MAHPNRIYPRAGDAQTVYLKNVVKSPNIQVGTTRCITIASATLGRSRKNNVLYHYPVNGDRLVIGKFCSMPAAQNFQQRESRHGLLFHPTFPLF